MEELTAITQLIAILRTLRPDLLAAMIGYGSAQRVMYGEPRLIDVVQGALALGLAPLELFQPGATLHGSRKECA